MNLVEQAKEKVGKLFAALDAPKDTCWIERVSGGFVSEAALPTGMAHGFVDSSGYYEVVFSRDEHSVATILLGSFEQKIETVNGTDRNPQMGRSPWEDIEDEARARMKGAS